MDGLRGCRHKRVGLSSLGLLYPAEGVSFFVMTRFLQRDSEHVLPEKELDSSLRVVKAATDTRSSACKGSDMLGSSRTKGSKGGFMVHICRNGIVGYAIWPNWYGSFGPQQRDRASISSVTPLWVQSRSWFQSYLVSPKDMAPISGL